MRTIERTTQFRRDYKRLARTPRGEVLLTEFARLVTALATDAPLAERHRDHALFGEWLDHRDCHLRPDVVLIYRKPDADTLQLVRIGSHSELSL